MGFLDINALANLGAQQIGGSRQAGVNQPTVKPGVNAPGLGAKAATAAAIARGVPASPPATVTVAAHTRAAPGTARAPAASGAPAVASAGPQDPQSIVDASLAQLRTQLQGDYSNHVSQGTAALLAASKTLLSMLQGIPAQTSADYNQMLQQQTTLGQVGSAGLAAANPNGQLQSDLSAVGAPASQQAQLAGQMNNVFNGGAAALLGQTAVIPGQQISTDELAALTHARTLPSIAAMQAQSEIGKFLAGQGNTLQNQLFQVDQTRPGLINSANAAAASLAQNKINNQFRVDQLNSTNFYRQAQLGVATKKDAFNQWATEQRLGLTAKSQSFNQWAKVQGLQIQGQQVAISQQNANTNAARAARAAATGPAGGKMKLQHINGHWVKVDPAGNTYLPGTTTPVDPNSLKTPVKPATAAQLSAARNFVRASSTGYYAYKNQDSKPLSNADLARLAKTAGAQASIPGGIPVHDFLTAPQYQAARDAAGIGYYQHNQHEDPAIQQMYISLIKDYGLPARQAFELVGSTYKAWADHNRPQYFPKGSASPSAGTASGASYSGQPGGNPQAVSYITSKAASLGLDPAAVLAVARQEGWGGGVGDSGTSFGPWQLHQGGALPQGISLASAHQWAWSQQGLDYALQQMASVARGLRGQAAVNAIVNRFERPANPGGESSRAWANYGGRA
jgi:hypothetical protein